MIKMIDHILWDRYRIAFDYVYIIHHSKKG